MSETKSYNFSRIQILATNKILFEYLKFILNEDLFVNTKNVNAIRKLYVRKKMHIKILFTIRLIF